MVENKERTDSQKFLWEQFCRLGERIGDGDHDPWMAREYKRLSKILVPEIKEMYKKRRAAKTKSMNNAVKKYLDFHKCPKCKGELRQSRSGSVICYCLNCKGRFKLK
ncbi:zf-TFIIB domain-containing protein [Candidatus Pacearchaeota archaeon]|nr:zf-TFIIB domain-containing protein [Candidatus Pacearchaeota archaeon]